MTSLPNPFADSGATHFGAAASSDAFDRSQSPDAAAEITDTQKLLAEIEDDYRFVLDEDKFLFDIGCIPEDFAKYMAMMDALVENDDPPLFLQRTG